MHVSIPKTRFTREISFAAGVNEAGERAVSAVTIDDNWLFILAFYFKPRCWPGFVYYNGDHKQGAGGKYKPFHIRPRRVFA